MNKTFAQRLKELRKESKQTQDDIAKILNVRRSTYGEYERGKIKPPADKIFKLASLFSVSVEYLVGNVNIKTEGISKSTDVSEHLDLFIGWLEAEEHPKTFMGEPLSDLECLILAKALSNISEITKIRKGLNYE